MPIHRFTVNIPNPTARKAVARLRLVPVKVTDLKRLALDLPGKLDIVSAGITEDPCATGDRTELRLGLAPQESVDVHVVIDTGVGGEGAVAFNLVDERPHRTGGVMLLCVEPALTESAGQLVPTARPCPVVLGGDAYAVARGADPSKPPSDGRIPLEADLELVAPITNPRSRRLEEVEVYLEHLGLSDAEFTPGTWSVGSLAAGDLFFATWPLRTSGQMTGTFDACVVVASRGKDPVRLHALIEISAKVRPERPRSSSR